MSARSTSNAQVCLGWPAQPDTRRTNITFSQTGHERWREGDLAFATASVDAAGAFPLAGASIGEVVEMAVSAFTLAVGAEEAGASCHLSNSGRPVDFFFSQPTRGSNRCV